MLLIERNLSCPAVSQISNKISLSLIISDLFANVAPIVALTLGSYLFKYLAIIDVFPTLLSPTIITLQRIIFSLFFSFYLKNYVLFFIIL